jgi:hypothetical protein
MYINQIFSYIKDEVIQNIVVCDNYTLANELARLTYGEDAIAVDTTLYPVGIGFKYVGGRFYDAEGVNEIFSNPTEAEQIAILKAQNQALLERLDLAESTLNYVILGGGE